MTRTVALLAACCSTCMGLMLPPISTAAPLSIAVPSIAVPTTTTLAVKGIVDDVFLRDPVDIYYGAIAAVAFVVVAKNFATNQLDQAKAQDEAKATSNKQLTDAFKQARDRQ